MWLLLAFTSAALLGFYDVFKKQALKTNPVVPVLTLNTLFCSLIFLPFIILSATGQIPESSIFYVPVCGWEVHKYIVLKSIIVLSSWLCGYYAIQNLPITLVGPINATRPVMVLLGAIFVFGERLNLYQWVGVLFAIFGFFLLSRSGKKEGIDFRHNRWIFLAVLASALGAVSGLYDKYLLAPVESGGVGLNRMVVQSYFNIYQFGMMVVVCWKRRPTPLPQPSVANGEFAPLCGAEATFSCFSEDPSRPSGRGERPSPRSPVRGRASQCSIAARQPLPSLTGGVRGWVWVFSISLFLSVADFAYFYALSLPAAMISVVSMIRRGSVLVSFTVGALIFREKNLRSKALDLAFVLLSMVFLWLGSR